MRKIGIVIPLLWLIFFSSQSQPNKLDSLSRLLKSYPESDSIKVDILNDLAFEYLHKNPKILREYIKESQRIADNIKYEKGRARGLNVLGSSFWAEGEYTLALDYYLQSLKIYERIDDKNGIYFCYNNIGEVYKKIENYELALIYQEQSLALKDKYLPEVSPGLSYINIGEIYLKTEEFNLAKEYFDKALILSFEEDDLRIKGYAYAGLGLVHFGFGEFETAVFHLEQSLDVRKTNNDILGMIQSYMFIGDIYLNITHFDLAEEHYLKAQQKSVELGAKEYEIRAFKGLFNVDSTRGNYKEALRYNFIYNHLKDSLFTLAKEKQMDRIKTIYEVEKKDKENALLLKDKEANMKMLEYQKLINVGGGLVLLAFIGMSVLLFRQVKRQKATHIQLHEKNQLVIDQKDKLLVNAQKLKELNENLEKTVKERTGIILKKNEKLKEFAYMNAHNVRGPLSNILGLTYLLKKQELDKEQEELVSHLNKSAEKLDSEFHQLRTNMEEEERS